MRFQKARILSLIEATLVTFLWSTSYIMIRIGLKEINPLTFAAYRYIIASFILLLPLYFQWKREEAKKINSKHIVKFFLLGFTGYFIAQGLQFFGLYFLNPVTVTFILNLTPIFVLGLSIVLLNEHPSTIQLLGITLTLIGVFIFFYAKGQIL